MEVLRALAPQFECTTGHHLSAGYDPTNAIKRQIEDGAVFDVAIVTRLVLDDLTQQGIIAPDTRANIARCGLGIAVRKGAPKPDIGTTEAFARTMLAATSVVRSTEGASGIHFEQLLRRLGIADQMKDKIRLGQSGRVAELVARGEAEIAVQQISELLPVAGTDFVGPLPPDLQLFTVFAAGVNTSSTNPAAAKALIDLLIAPATAALFTAGGLKPLACGAR